MALKGIRKALGLYKDTPEEEYAHKKEGFIDTFRDIDQDFVTDKIPEGIVSEFFEGLDSLCEYAVENDLASHDGDFYYTQLLRIVGMQFNPFSSNVHKMNLIDKLFREFADKYGAEIKKNNPARRADLVKASKGFLGKVKEFRENEVKVIDFKLEAAEHETEDAIKVLSDSNLAKINLFRSYEKIFPRYTPDQIKGKIPYLKLILAFPALCDKQKKYIGLFLPGNYKKKDRVSRDQVYLANLFHLLSKYGAHDEEVVKSLGLLRFYAERWELEDGEFPTSDYMEHYYNFYEKMGKLHKKLEEEIKVVFETGTAYFTYIDNHSPPSIPNPKKPTHGEVDRTLEWFSENILTLEETIKKEELDYFPPFERALRNLINGIYEHFGLK